MSYRTIVVSSRAMGQRDYVTVKVYDTAAEILAAGRRYNGCVNPPDTLAVTQAAYNADETSARVTVRLVRGKLSTQIIGHELHHAATAIYGAAQPRRIAARAHLHHYNEPMAHLFSDLLAHLVDRLYALGYYDD